MKRKDMVNRNMKITVRRTIAGGMCAVLMGLCLCGCGRESSTENIDVTPTPVISESSEPTGNAEPEKEAASEPTKIPEAAATPVPEDPEAEYWAEVLKEFSDSEYDLTEALTGAGLKNLCADYFKLGVGLTGAGYSTMAIHSKEYMAVTKKHFNSVTLTNLMKPCFILDQKGSLENVKNGEDTPALRFDDIREILQWCQDNDVQMRGHTLVWHTQTPDWFFREGFTNDGAYVDRETMLARLDSYIGGYMTFCQENYPGVVYCWDVVNEAVDPDRGDENSYYHCRTEIDGGVNPWYAVVGDDYVEQAFRIARKYAAEDVKLFYNDYNAYETRKCQYIYNLCEHLAAEGLIDGIGMQGYWSLTYPSTNTIELAINKYAELGLEIQITELSVGVDNPTPEEFDKQASRYSSLFFMLSKLDQDGGGKANITAVTLFGLMDGYVLYDSDSTNTRIFDTNFQPKPAFHMIKKTMSYSYKKK